MEYSSNKSNRSLRSIQLTEIEPTEVIENSIIMEENDSTTKYSDQRKKISLPKIKNNNKTINSKPMVYYSLQLQRNKLGTLSTRVIKDKVNKIRKKCNSIANAIIDRGANDNSSTTDTFKNGQYLKRVHKDNVINKNHRILSNRRYNNPMAKVRSTSNFAKTKLKSRLNGYLK
jgi:hypothetical protein